MYYQLYNLVKGQLTDKQHGFLQRRSCSTNLVTFCENINANVDNRTQVDAVYTDFSKAFDTVQHSILLHKMCTVFGVDGPMLKWFETYLRDRTCFVVVNGYKSSNFKQFSGVPQGSHLGPLLFVIFINDIQNCFKHTDAYLFADDLKTIRPIKSIHDSKLIQEDLVRLQDWCRLNKMLLNSSKCYCLSFSRNQNILPTSYHINNVKLEKVSIIRDLGVIFDSKLTFRPQYDNILIKSSRMMGFIIRNSKNFKPKTKLILYNSLVRSTLEYCCQVWSPFYDVHKNRIERIQKRFLNHLTFCSYKKRTLRSYSSRLNYFKILSLNNRRKLLDMSFFFKLLNNQLDCPPLLSSINLNIPFKMARAHVYKLFKEKPHKTNLGMNSPITRMIKMYNSFPKNCNFDIFSEHLHAFKRKLITYFTHLDKHI